MKFDKPLTDAQRILVEDSLNIAQWTVQNYIKTNDTISGLGYEDLQQEAYLALCSAAATYQEGGAQFKTYAVTVIRNHLIDYCRRICRNNRALPTFSLDAPHGDAGDDPTPTEPVDTDACFEECCLSNLWIREFLAQRKSSYTGCAKLGIEALELKVLDGYGVTDIASLYHARPNLVGAWISKATRKLREELTASGCSILDVENYLTRS